MSTASSSPDDDATMWLMDIAAIDDRIRATLRRRSVPALRMSLAVVFVWFGALKVFDVTPVDDLVAQTVYFADPAVVVPVLGVAEVLIGLGLAFRVAIRIVTFLLLTQLAGTALVLVVLPEVAFVDGNPLLLTTEGEFVIKNLVLISAGLVIGAFAGEPTESMGGAATRS